MVAVAPLVETFAIRRPGRLVPAALLAVGLAVAAAFGLQAEGALDRVILTALLTVLAAIAALDSKVLRAPNRIVYPTAIAATAAPFALGLDAGAQALLGGLAAFAVVLVIVLAGRGKMGYGDAKVAYICGAVVGVTNVALLVVATFAVGGTFAALALTVGRRGRKDAVAFTPFLFLGVIAALALGGHGVYRLPGL